MNHWYVTVCRKRYKIECMGQAVAWVDLDSPNADENVRLLCAAKDLLAALKELDAAHDHETLCRAKEHARVAIAKAICHP